MLSSLQFLMCVSDIPVSIKQDYCVQVNSNREHCPPAPCRKSNLRKALLSSTHASSKLGVLWYKIIFVVNIFLQGDKIMPRFTAGRDKIIPEHNVASIAQ